MPVVRVPVVHKFGIISHSQRLELQERLLKQTYHQSTKSRGVHVSQRNPIELTEEFVQRFNNAETLQEKDQCQETARKLLERAKRRAGIRQNGSGNHVNLPLAWTELAQIAQCKGIIQEECLDVLTASLDSSPLAKYHVPALFFLAETMLFWLRTDAIHQPYLRTAEIKLLKMGQLVFHRLFYHHMAGQLQGHTNFKNRLFTYTDGLVFCQEAYNPYPNALLSLRLIIEVSRIILADAVIEAGEVKEGDNLPDAPRHDMQDLENVTRAMYQQRDGDGVSTASGAISSSVHDLSPTLWHALDVWRCTSSVSGGLADALVALGRCGNGLGGETWVDGVVALNILAETAKANAGAMRVFQHLALGVSQEEAATPPLSTPSSQSDTLSFSSSEDDPLDKRSQSRDIHCSPRLSLSDIYERSDENDSDQKQDSEGSGVAPTASYSVDACGLRFSHQDGLEKGKGKNVKKTKAVIPEPTAPQKMKLKSREVSFDETAITKDQTGNNNKENPVGGSGSSNDTREERFQPAAFDAASQDVGTATKTASGTGSKADAGSEFYTSRGSDASSAPTFTNLPLPEAAGISSWHWEVAFTFTDMLAEICIHGNSAAIQKMALVGAETNVAGMRISGAGLVDLASFQAPNETEDSGPNDWSWRVRYGAVQGLVRVVHSLSGDPQREGLRGAAWRTLLHAHRAERDPRVLEALKVGEVHTDIAGIQGPAASEGRMSIGGRIAAGLSLMYLPPLPPPVDTSTIKSSRRPRRLQPNKPPLSNRRSPLRTSLKEELDLAKSLRKPPVDFNTRTSFDLRRIVEDQWRKDLQRTLEEEEEERRKELARKQEEEEEQQRKREENKARKLQANRPLRKASAGKPPST